MLAETHMCEQWVTKSMMHSWAFGARKIPNIGMISRIIRNHEKITKNIVFIYSSDGTITRHIFWTRLCYSSWNICLASVQFWGILEFTTWLEIFLYSFAFLSGSSIELCIIIFPYSCSKCYIEKIGDYKVHKIQWMKII